MNMHTLQQAAALAGLEERKKYLIDRDRRSFIVLPPSATKREEKIFSGFRNECQLFIEQRGFAASMRFLQEHCAECDDFPWQTRPFEDVFSSLANQQDFRRRSVWSAAIA